MPSPSPSASPSSISPHGRAGPIVGAILGVLGAVTVERRRHAQAEATLRRETAEREAERTLLAAQLVTAEQDERRRLAVALHDGPLQSLSGIALMHDAALAALREDRPDEAVNVIERALQRERELIQTVRDLSFALEPVILRDQGFGAAVRALANQIEQARRISVTLDVGAGARPGGEGGGGGAAPTGLEGGSRRPPLRRPQGRLLSPPGRRAALRVPSRGTLDERRFTDRSSRAVSAAIRPRT